MRCLIFCLCLVSLNLWAEDKEAPEPEYYLELGAGLIGQLAPDYRGTKQQSWYVLPIPYLRFKSRLLNLDRKGVHSELFNNQKLELSFSADGSLNGKSEDNPLREGMPELDSAFELGPSLNFNLSGRNFDEGWALRLPARAVFTLSTSEIQHIGYLFNPRFTWRKSDLVSGWRSSLNLGLLYADKRYHHYYYGVDQPYVKPDRQAYRTEAGYSGEFIRWSLYKTKNDWRYGVSLRYDNLRRANFIDGPLVETEHYASISFAIIKSFWRSREGVRSEF